MICGGQRANSTLTFESICLNHRLGDGSFLPRPEVLTSAHLALFAQDTERQHFIGNAALIAPGLAIAATHVIDDYDEKFRSGVALLLGGGWDQGRSTSWICEGATRVPRTDLAVLALRPSVVQDDCSYCHFASAIRVPRKDERVMVMSSLPRREAVVDLPANALLELTPHCRVGRVTEIYAFGRDRRTLPWACVEVDMATEGGMSGAPVFNQEGELFGVVCSSFGGGDGQDARPTYVSLLYPAMLHTCVRTWPMKEELPLCEMQCLELDRPYAFSRDRAGNLIGDIQFIF